MNERIEFNSSHMHHLARRQLPGSLSPHSHLVGLMEQLGNDLAFLLDEGDRKGQLALEGAIEVVCDYIKKVYGEQAEEMLFAHLEATSTEVLKDLKGEAHA